MSSGFTRLFYFFAYLIFNKTRNFVDQNFSEEKLVNKIGQQL